MQKKLKKRSVNGILLLNKPIGISSNQALQRAKYIYKASKAGHTGSLDVLATGMLPICFGEASKFSQFLLDADKCYETIAQLGEFRTTGDAEGEVTQRFDVPDFSENTIQEALRELTGAIEQTPPMYSALKQNGKPLYSLARQGIEVERKARRVTIYSFRLKERKQDSLRLAVHCSKGTYIRTLVEDLGRLLGCGAYVAQLHRTEVSIFKGDMHELEPLQGMTDFQDLDALLLPMDAALKHFPSCSLDFEQTQRLQQGQLIRMNDCPALEASSLVRLYAKEDQQFLGIAQWKDEVLYPKRLIANS